MVVASERRNGRSRARQRRQHRIAGWPARGRLVGIQRRRRGHLVLRQRAADRARCVGGAGPTRQWGSAVRANRHPAFRAAGATPRSRISFANTCARLWLGLPPDCDDGAREKFLVAASRTFACQPAESWQGWPDIPAATAASSRLLVRPETPQACAFFLEVSVNENTDSRLLRLCDVTGRLAARRDQRSFQAMVSHKLRTPLNGVLGSLELLAAPGALTATEIAEFVAMAREGAVRLFGAVDDVLRFAELSKPPAPGAGFALAGLDELVRRVAAGLSLPTVAVSVVAEARAASIACAPEALEWVLFELLENAKKFHPRHAPAVEVNARLEEQGWVNLVVSDNGATLSPEQLIRAGSPFFQGEKYFTGEASGMGLGLASVFALVWQAGGSCHLGNQPAGPGVRVELKWPFAVATMELITGGDGSRPLTTQQARIL